MGRISMTIASTLSARIAELQRLDAAIRRPLPLSTRVGLVGVASGIGCSVAAGLVASVLASRRSYRVLAVNASRSSRSLLWYAGFTSNATSTRAQDAARGAARQSSEAVGGLSVAPNGLFGLDLYDGMEPLGDDRWLEAVGPSTRFFDFVLTDWGVRDRESLSAVLLASTVVVVAVAADRISLQHGVDLAQVIEEAGAQVLLAVIDSTGRRAAPVGDMMRMLPFGAVEFGHDRVHGSAHPEPSTCLRATTNLAALRLAAALVGSAAIGRTTVRRPSR